MINKKTALFFVVVSVLYFVTYILEIFLWETSLFENFRHGRVRQLEFYFSSKAVHDFSEAVIYLGLFGLFWALNERRFIRVGAIMYAMWKIVFASLNFFGQYNTTIYSWLGHLQFIEFNFAPMLILYFIITLLFVKNKLIKKHVRFVFALYPLFPVLQYAAGICYDHFGYNWLDYIGPRFNELPLIGMMILFVHVYNNTDRYNSVYDADLSDINGILHKKIKVQANIKQ